MHLNVSSPGRGPVLFFHFALAAMSGRCRA
jgi:hypothetical protein